MNLAPIAPESVAPESIAPESVAQESVAPETSAPERGIVEHPTGELAIRTIAMPADTNANGDIFGGWLMAQMDLAGGNLALRRARGRAATVAVDRMTFISPVSVGDEVTIYARIVATGRTSMRIQIEAWKRARSAEATTKVTAAIFVFVAIDDQRRPRPLPPE